nr:MAG TPA: hypothetical protein [Caudoviricetes sp.]
MRVQLTHLCRCHNTLRTFPPSYPAWQGLFHRFRLWCDFSVLALNLCA